MVEWNHISTCHSEGANASRGIFPSCLFYLVVVHSPTWWIPPLRFAAVGMTYLRGGFVYPHGLFLQRFPERHTGRSLRFRWWAVPFNHTGCIRNAAGGRLPPLQYICSESPCFQRVCHRFASVKYQKRNALPPLQVWYLFANYIIR